MTPDINGEFAVIGYLASRQVRKNQHMWIEKERKQFSINNAIKIAKIAAEGALWSLLNYLYVRCELQPEIQTECAMHKLTHRTARAITMVRNRHNEVLLNKREAAEYVKLSLNL